MKNNFRFIGKFFLPLLIVAFIAGCATEQPPVVISSPNPVAGLPPIVITNPPVYAEPPALVNTLSNIQAETAAFAPTVGALVPPAAPFIPLGQALLAAVCGIITTVSTGIAYVKNSQAQSHAKAAATLAAAVVQNPSVETAATAIAANNGAASAVAIHLAAAKSLT